jgi:hypothetical protein
VDHRDVAVKVFLSGVLRSERPYLHRVLVTVRGWREFCASRRAADALLRGPAGATEVGHLRWWLEHVATVADAGARGYPIRFVAYEDVLADPGGTVADVLDWLGVSGDVGAGADAVSPALRTQVQPPAPPGMPAAWVEGFDALYSALRTCPDDALGFGGLHAEVVEAARDYGPRTDPWAARE